MALATTATHYTPEDLLALSDDSRFELIDERLVEHRIGARATCAATNLPGLVWHFVRNNSPRLVLQADCGYQIFAEEPNRIWFTDESFITSAGNFLRTVHPGGAVVSPRLSL
jgi:hypothetical protein